MKSGELLKFANQNITAAGKALALSNRLSLTNIKRGRKILNDQQLKMYFMQLHQMSFFLNINFRITC